jgi:hypothetical protein
VDYLGIAPDRSLESSSVLPAVAGNKENRKRGTAKNREDSIIVQRSPSFFATKNIDICRFYKTAKMTPGTHGMARRQNTLKRQSNDK